MYRDNNDLCPRCGIPLVQAGRARGCEECKGVFFTTEDVRDMASAMQSPPAPVQLGGVEDGHLPLPCPTCTEPMRPLLTHGVSIDVCKKGHGIWFDANELGTLLFRLAQPSSS